MANDLRNVRLNELSLVKRGANPGARVVLVKRDFTQAERDKAEATGAAMPGGRYPIKSANDVTNAVRDYNRTGKPADVKAHIISRARSLGATSELPDGWVTKSADPLKSALVHIIKQEMEGDDDALSTFAEELDEQEGDEELRSLVSCLMNTIIEAGCSDASSDEKVGAIATSASQFLSTLRERFPDAVKSLTKALTENPATAGFFTEASEERNDPMTEAEKKDFEALKKSLEDATKKIADLSKASMSDKHSAYMAQLPEEKRSDFAAKSPDERDAHMEKNPIKKSEAEQLIDALKKVGIKDAGDEQLTIGTTVIRKADNPVIFDVVKALHGTVTAQAEQLSKSEDARAEAELVTKVKAEFPNVPGEAIEKARMLRALEKLDPKVKQTVEKIMAAANKAMGDRLSEIGKGGEAQIGTAEEKLNSLAKTYSEEHKVSFAKAYDHVLTSNAKLYEEYLTEKSRARAA